MGNTNQMLEKNITYIQNLQDRHFGDIEIYRSQDCHYLMKNKRTHISGDKRYNEFKKIIEFVQKQTKQRNDKNFLVPIMNISLQHEKNICIEYEISEILTQYYNFTLQDFIIHKKQIEQAQLWYILQSLLELIKLLKSHNLGVNFTLDNIFVTLKGHACVYMYHILPFEEYISCNQFGMCEEVARIILQLALIEIIHYKELENTQIVSQTTQMLGKMFKKYHILSQLLKSLIHREKKEEQLLTDIIELKKTNQIKIATEIRLNKFKYLIPEIKENNGGESFKIKQNQNEQKVLEDIKSIDIKGNNKKEKLQQNQKISNKKANKQNAFSETKKITPSFSKSSMKLKTEMSELNNSNHKNQICLSTNLQNFSKQNTQKILEEIDRKKQQNFLESEKFKMRKEEVLNLTEKQNYTQNNTSIQSIQSIRESNYKKKEAFTRKSINEMLKFSQRK